MPPGKKDDYEALLNETSIAEKILPTVDPAALAAHREPLAPRSNVRNAGGEAESASSLQRRVRKGTDSFDFKALIHGVSTLESSRSVVPYEAIEPVQPRRASRIWIWPAALLCLGLAVFSYRLFTGRAGESTSGAPASSGLPLPGNPYAQRGLPDPNLTPGDRASTPQSAKGIGRDLRLKVLQEYGIDPNEPHYQICRLIPPALGGTDRINNLFPAIPLNADLKARLDKRLVELVYSRSMTAKQAVTELTSNWLVATHTHFIRNYGERDVVRAKQTEETLRTAAFKSSATVSPATIDRGGTATITATVAATSGSLIDGIVNVYVYTPSGRFDQQYFQGQTISPRQSRAYSCVWTAPNVPGTYHVKVGVFKNWSALISWNDTPATINVR